jgi:hypothetical protein
MGVEGKEYKKYGIHDLNNFDFNPLIQFHRQILDSANINLPNCHPICNQGTMYMGLTIQFAIVLLLAWEIDN